MQHKVLEIKEQMLDYQNQSDAASKHVQGAHRMAAAAKEEADRHQQECARVTTSLQDKEKQCQDLAVSALAVYLRRLSIYLSIYRFSFSNSILFYSILFYSVLFYYFLLCSVNFLFYSCSMFYLYVYLFICTYELVFHCIVWYCTVVVLNRQR
jgi:hypothetical protein